MSENWEDEGSDELPSEGLNLEDLLRSLYTIVRVLSSMKILFLNQEKLDEMKEILKEESIRQRIRG